MEKSITKGWIAVVTVFAAMTLALCAFAPAQAFGAENPGSNGFQVTASGKIFFENAKGKKVTGWFQVTGDGGKWYYADPSTGYLKNGWLSYGGKWYLLDKQDEAIPFMVADKIAYVSGKYVYWEKPDVYYTPYYLGKNGDMKIGWVKLPSGGWLYADSKGVLAEGWKKINGKWYYFGNKPVPGDNMLFEGEWYPASTASGNAPEKVGKYMYYFGKDTAMVTGWQKAGGKWYYFKADGAMVANKWLKDGGKWYYLGADGVMKTGWLKSGGKWYYLGANGAMKTGWVKSGGKWYFLNASGAMLANKWVQTNGKWYFVGSDGAMITNAWVDVWHVGANGAWDKSKNNNDVTPTDPPKDPEIIFTA